MAGRIGPGACDAEAYRVRSNAHPNGSKIAHLPALAHLTFDPANDGPPALTLATGRIRRLWGFGPSVARVFAIHAGYGGRHD